MPDRFRGKTWIYWAQFIICGFFTIFCLIFGPLFWLSILKDANNEPRPNAGPPLTIMGLVFLSVAGLGLANILGRRVPVICCFKEGFECNLVGKTDLPTLPLLEEINVAYAILSLKGFKSFVARISWEEFCGADVTGIPMAYRLILKGNFIIPKTGKMMSEVKFKQVEFIDDPNLIADTLNRFARDEALTERLPGWKNENQTLLRRK